MTQVEKLKTKAKLLVKAKKKRGINLRLKDALNAIAKLAGFHSWRDLRKSPDDEFFYRPSGVLLNHCAKLMRRHNRY